MYFFRWKPTQIRLSVSQRCRAQEARVRSSRRKGCCCWQREDVCCSLVWQQTCHALSTFVGAEPVGNVRRWDETKKEETFVSCPQIVSVYNKQMGSVDLLDSLIGLYWCKICSKQWYHSIFFHLLDLTVVNSWLMYKRTMSVKGDRPLRLHSFKAAIAEGLCKVGACGNRGNKRCRPAQEITQPTKRQRQQAAPVEDVPCDNVDHFTKWGPRQCGKLSRVSCRKCGVSLCFNQQNNCFYAYHTSW